MMRLLLLPVLAFGPLPSFAQPVSAEFSKPTLIFVMTVHNPSTDTRHLVKVGVESKVQGTFTCLAGASGLTSLADYPVRFRVQSPETLIDADPVLELPAKSAARFSISLYPIATGACGYWVATVRAIAVFDDGNRVYSEPEQIDVQDVFKTLNRNPSLEEVLGCLKHRDWVVRRQGLRKVAGMNMDRETALAVVGAKFDDPVRSLRREAYLTAAAMKLTELAPSLVMRYGKIPPNDPKTESSSEYEFEVTDLCRALGELKAAAAVDVLMAALMNEKAGNAFFDAWQALEKLPGPPVTSKALPVLEKYSAWAKDKPCSYSARLNCSTRSQRIGYLLDLVLSYRLMNTIDPLNSLMRDEPAYADQVLERLEWVVAGKKDGQLVQDPFLLSFRTLAQANVTNQSRETRENAILFLASISQSQEDARAILTAGLNDPDTEIRCQSAYRAGKLRVNSLVSTLYAKYPAASSSDEK